MENAWQYTKVYRDQIDIKTGNPNENWWKFATDGFNRDKADRFPRV